MTQDIAHTLQQIENGLQKDTEDAIGKVHEGSEQMPQVCFLIKPDSEGEADFANAISRVQTFGNVRIAGVKVDKEPEGAKGFDKVTFDLAFN